MGIDMRRIAALLALVAVAGTLTAGGQGERGGEPIDRSDAPAAQPAGDDDHDDEYADDDHADDDHADDHELIGVELPHIEPIVTAGQRLTIVATTSIVGDVVAQVAGDAADLSVLMPLGQDPHGWQATPRAMASIERAQLLFVNGFDLEEELMDPIRELAGGYVVPVSYGIAPIEGDDHGHDDDDHDDDDHADEDHADEDHADDDHADDDHADDDHDHAAGDPHVWMDPTNVMSWVDVIADSLAAADPANAATYRSNAAAYRLELTALDREVRAAVSTIPSARRQLVLDHAAIDYFADEYGFEIIGAVLPGTTTEAEPSARAIAELVEQIRATEVPAIFVGGTAGRGLRAMVDAVAAEVGRPIAVAELLTGSLAPAGRRGDTYLDFVRLNVERIVAALGSGS